MTTLHLGVIDLPYANAVRHGLFNDDRHRGSADRRPLLGTVEADAISSGRVHVNERQARLTKRVKKANDPVLTKREVLALG